MSNAENFKQDVYFRYRIVREPIYEEDTIKGYLCTIREVYFYQDKVISFSVPIEPTGETPHDIGKCLRKMQRALKEPLLELPELEKQVEENAHLVEIAKDLIGSLHRVWIRE